MDRDFLQRVVDTLLSFGADHVTILASEHDTISAISRLTKIVQLTEATTDNIQIRASVGKQHAVISTNSQEDLEDKEFLLRVVDAAQNSPKDELQIDPDQVPQKTNEMDICDPAIITPQMLSDIAIECEQKTLDTSGITNSEGAEVAYTKSKIMFQRDSIHKSYCKTSFQASVVALAEKNGELQQDYSFSNSIFFKDMKSCDEIARDAAARTLQKLGSRKIKTCEVPVIFERRCAGSLLSSILNAINGANVAKNMSFLKHSLHNKIMSDAISIYDNHKDGIRARPFDSEGLNSKINELVAHGCLQSFLLNTKYANKLEMQSTRSAMGFQAIAPNNVYIKNGTVELSELISIIDRGLLITELMGDGFNILTGDFSTGACGFWIEHGQVQYPVNEITLASNFANMFGNCAIANDLTIETGCDSPSIFVENITVGGE